MKPCIDCSKGSGTSARMLTVPALSIRNSLNAHQFPTGDGRGQQEAHRPLPSHSHRKIPGRTARLTQRDSRHAPRCRGPRRLSTGKRHAAAFSPDQGGQRRSGS